MAKKPGQIRIIGGKWRGRRIALPASLACRPTPDRVKETLFNWLMPSIKGAYCLDLFAGSGALGLEALSRGAEFVTLCERDPEIVEHLRSSQQMLQADNLAIETVTIPTSLTLSHDVDIVFLDPPFKQGLIESCVLWLQQVPWLTQNALLYTECEVTLTPALSNKHWTCLKQQSAGQVNYALWQYLKPH